MDLVKHCDITDLDRLDVLLLPCNSVHRVPFAFKSGQWFPLCEVKLWYLCLSILCRNPTILFSNALPIDDNFRSHIFHILDDFLTFCGNLSSLRLLLNFSVLSYSRVFYCLETWYKPEMHLNVICWSFLSETHLGSQNIDSRKYEHLMTLETSAVHALSFAIALVLNGVDQNKSLKPYLLLYH